MGMETKQCVVHTQCFFSFSVIDFYYLADGLLASSNVPAFRQENDFIIFLNSLFYQFIAV